MISRWPGTSFAECDHGKFEVALLEFDYDIYDWKMIAYSDGRTLVKTEAFANKPIEIGALMEFADQYELEIV